MMEFTEKDMYYITEGRTNKERARIVVPWFVLALILCLPAGFLIENEGTQVGVWLAVIVICMWLPLKRYLKSYKEVKEQSKVMYQRWLIREQGTKDCLEVTRAAILDSIATEDGLDGSCGEAAIKWITDILGDYEEWHRSLGKCE